MQITVRNCLLGLALLTQAEVNATVVDESPCLARADSYTISACRQWADKIGADRERIIALGHRLEVTGNYRAAVAVYKIARQHHAADKELLKRFIRAQSEWRGQQLLAGTTDSASQQTADLRERPAETGTLPVIARPERLQLSGTGSSACRDQRWMDALNACQRDLERTPDDGALHERLGDVYRSLGQPEKALRHYRKSLDLIPDNLSAGRKHRALASLVGDESTDVRASVPPLPASVAVTPDASASWNAIDSASERSVVQQLELLDDLHNRKLVSTDEYRQRRSQVLEDVFASDKRTEKTALLNDDTGLQKTVYRSVDDSIDTGHYHALVIGNNRYRHFPALQTAVSDATAVSELLRNRYGFDVKTLINSSRYDILKALSMLRRRLTEKDNLLIYYAGHGVIDDTTRRGYWLPVEAEQDNIANWISAADVTDTLSGIDAKHAIVVADSCYSGSLLRSVGQLDLDQRAALLKRLSGKRSRTVLTSGGLEPVLDDGDGTHSVFARAFIDILSENDELLEAGRLFGKLRARVVLNADQTPQYAPIRHAGHDGGDFIFVPR